jgi:hypothetical protein
MGFSRAGIWPGVILTAIFAVNCGDDGDSGPASPAAGTSAEGGSAGSGPNLGGDTGTGISGGPSAGGAGGTDGQSQGGLGGASEPTAGAGGEGALGAGGTPPVFVTSTKLDLLFVVDNSISMSDKQALFAASIPALVERLVKPWCIGGPAPVPPNSDGSCPVNTAPEYPSVRDLHVGVITSSLGSHGSQVCTAATEGIDDRAHLIGSVRTGVTSWNDSGFLKWDPDGLASPPGESDSGLLADDMAAMVVAAADSGCGFEAPLEAMYRFLIDPEPPLTVSQVGGVTVASGIDDVLLAQRQAFVRPDSAIMVVVISDENDCSIIDQGQGWLVGLQTNGGTPFTMPRATAACAIDPNDVCCRSCASNEAGGPPNGCSTLAADPVCSLGTNYAAGDDNLNLRCFQQKRRFGFDLLWPLSRYVNGLSLATVLNRAGEPVDNPLFAGGRDPSMVMLTVISGVPWQDIAIDPDPSADLDFLTTEQLTAQGRWPIIVGDVGNYVDPLDPFMIESVDPRSGLNPITNDPIVDETSTNPLATINGHESAMPTRSDLQYACIFPLAAPMDCSLVSDNACDCFAEDIPRNRPLCQPPEGGPAGTMQYFAKAYPGLRQLDVARQLASKSAVASICPRNSENVEADDYGYYPALRALQVRLATRLVPQ